MRAWIGSNERYLGMKWYSRQILIALAVVGCFVFALLWPGLPSPRPLVVAVGTRMGSEALVFALAQGVPLPARELRLVEMVGVTALARALENEVVDAAILSLDESLQMGDGGQPVRIALLLERSIGADVLLAPARISRIEDLRGCRIGVELRSAGHYLLHKALTSVGMDLRDVELIPLTAREVPNALDGQVDALVVTEPDLRHVKTKDLVRLFDSRELKKPIVRVLAVRKAVWEENREVLREVCARYFDAQPKMTAEHAEFVAFIARRTGLTESEARDAILRCEFLDREEMLSLAKEGGVDDILAAKRLEMIRAELLVGEKEDLAAVETEIWERR
jgi:ABC-type nitrate/sulfonate/bicarbonate transport system substrate-binding protein